MLSEKEKEKRRLQYKWVAAIPMICIIIYFVLAYILDTFVESVEHPYLISLLVFLVIPFEYVIVGLKKFTISYPVFIALFYVVLCIILQTSGISLWHPLWVVFLTIPIYYIFKSKNTPEGYVDEARERIKDNLNEYGCDFDSDDDNK